ncbi:MAG: pyridoxal-phosphate dependent enzyme [Flavobacteriaceae bacterium]|nr:pyridoxal-phosphate dependent enzyme [Flavobacteriaceae bacterium]
MTRETLQQAYNEIKDQVHRTPVLQSRLLNDKAKAALFFKCENFQKMGAFKMRGALHAIQKLNKEQKQKGVLTHSSGNFAQALSLAAKNLGVRAHIVMPDNAPQVKKEAVSSYDGNIYFSQSSANAREQKSEELLRQFGYSFIHPSNDIHVILGNATAAIELLEEIPDLDILITPVGGGGLIAGTALAGHFFGKTSIKIMGAEPKNVDDAYRSLQLGSIQKNNNTATIADGLRTHLGDVNFPIIQEYVSLILRVEEKDILSAMQLVWERMKIVIEPSSAVAVAAVLQHQEHFKNKKVGIIISGGNVDLSALPF